MSGRSIAALLLVAVALAGCGESKQQKINRFLTMCVASDFTMNQCRFLLAVYLEQNDENDSNAIMAGAAMGMAATSSIGRR